MVIVVLCRLRRRLRVGVLAMVPSWWRQRRVAHLAAPTIVVPADASPSTAPSTFGAEAAVPPREGL